MPGNLLILGWHNVNSTWCFPSDPGRGRQGLRQQLQLLRRAPGTSSTWPTHSGPFGTVGCSLTGRSRSRSTTDTATT